MKILKVSDNFKILSSLSLIASLLVFLHSDRNWLYPAEVSGNGSTSLETFLNSVNSLGKKHSQKKNQPQPQKREISFLVWNFHTAQLDSYCLGTSDLFHFHVQSHLLGLQMPSVFQGGSLVFFSLPAPRTVGSWCMTEASVNCAGSCTTWSEHRMLVTLQITNVTVECDGISLWGRLPALPAPATCQGASQHHLHHQDAARICCTALPKAPCDSVKAVTAGFTDMT